MILGTALVALVIAYTFMISCITLGAVDRNRCRRRILLIDDLCCATLFAFRGFRGLGAGLLGLFGLFIYLGILDEVVMGVVLGGSILFGIVLLILVIVIFVEVGERGAAQVPAHVRAVSPSAPRSLRWMRGLLPGGEGTVWLAEVVSSLAETSDKRVRRRYIRNYRREMPKLIWTSWSQYLSVSRHRELL